MAGSCPLYNRKVVFHTIIVPQRKIMITSGSVIVFAVIIQVIISQDDGQPLPPPPIDPNIPQQCWGPPQGVHLQRCCPIAPMYTSEDLEACGYEKPERGLPPKDHFNCVPQTCLFRNKGLLDADDKLDYDKIEPFVNEWAENQTHLIEGVQKAKEICFRKEDGPPVPQRPFGPFFNRSCEVDRLYICMTTNIIWNCQISEEGSCKALKTHMDECRQWLEKTPSQ